MPSSATRDSRARTMDAMSSSVWAASARAGVVEVNERRMLHEEGLDRSERIAPEPDVVEVDVARPLDREGLLIRAVLDEHGLHVVLPSQPLHGGEERVRLLHRPCRR